MSGFFGTNPPDTVVGSPDSDEQTIAENAQDQNDTASGFYQGSPEQTTTDAYTADALASKNAAAVSEANAATSAANAATSEANAATSATSASNVASSIAGDASSATASAASALASKNAAATSETNSATSETNAATSATTAATSATTATTKASEASVSAANAATSESNAATSATNAATSATNAASSESSVSANATAAATSASSAATSATSATASASTATTKAAEASTSKSNAATSATNAASSASSASTSATNASNSASSATTAQTAAEAARDSALAAFDSFDDRYLGQKSSNPSTDNDGNTLVAGTLYFNTTTGEMKVYDGSAWLNAYASLSGALTTTNNLSDLNNAGTARTNLGLGTAATTDASAYATAAQADQTVSLTGAGATSISGTYPSFTITSTDTDTTYSVGDGGLTQNNFTDALKTKLDGVATNANNYTLPFTDNSANWNTAFGWGNHASAGYLTSHQDISGKVSRDFQDSGQNLNIATNSTFAAGLLMKASNGGFRFNLYGNATQYGFLESDWGNWDLKKNINGQMLLRVAGTEYTVWHSGNDGSGSGLDSDTVDGIQASSFLRSDATTTFNSVGNNLEINGDGADRIGILWKEGTQRHWEQYITATDDLKFKSITGGEFQVEGNLTVDNGTNTTVDLVSNDNGMSQLRLYGSSQGTGRLFVGQTTAYGGGIEYNGDNSPSTTGSGADQITLYKIANNTVSWTAKNHVNSNDWNFRGNVTAYASDKRLKENIETIPNALDKVTQLRGVTFDWKDDCEEKGFVPSVKHETGVIAQDVQAVIPDATVPAPFDKNYLTVKHEKIIPLLIEAIKELKAEVDELKAAK